MRYEILHGLFSWMMHPEKLPSGRVVWLQDKGHMDDKKLVSGLHHIQVGEIVDMIASTHGLGWKEEHVQHLPQSRFFRFIDVEDST